MAQPVYSVAPSAADLAAYAARRTAFYEASLAQLSATAKEQLAALTPENIQGAIQAGLLTREGVAGLVQAGLLPKLAAILPPEVLAAIMAEGGDGAGVGAPGGPPGAPLGDVPGFTPSFGLAALDGLNAALHNATFGLSTTVGLTSPTNLSFAQSMLATLATIAGTLAGVMGPGPATAFSLGFGNAINAQIDAARLALSTQTGFVPAHDPALAALGLVSADPAVTGRAAIAAGLASGSSFVSLTAPEAQALALTGLVFADPTAPSGFVGFTGSHTAGGSAGFPSNDPANNPFHPDHLQTLAELAEADAANAAAASRRRCLSYRRCRGRPWWQHRDGSRGRRAVLAHGPRHRLLPIADLTRTEGTMLGKRKQIEQLTAIAARLEAVAVRLEPADAMAAYASLAVRDAVVVAADAALQHVLIDVRALVAAGERDQPALFKAAFAPLSQAFAAVPPPQMASAMLTATTVLISRLIDHMLAAAPMLPAMQRLAEDFCDGERS